MKCNIIGGLEKHLGSTCLSAMILIFFTIYLSLYLFMNRVKLPFGPRQDNWENTNQYHHYKVSHTPFIYLGLRPPLACPRNHICTCMKIRSINYSTTSATQEQRNLLQKPLQKVQSNLRPPLLNLCWNRSLGQREMKRCFSWNVETDRTVSN